MTRRSCELPCPGRVFQNLAPAVMALLVAEGADISEPCPYKTHNLEALNRHRRNIAHTERGRDISICISANHNHNIVDGSRGVWFLQQEKVKE